MFSFQDSIHLTECFEVSKDDLDALSTDGCAALFQNFNTIKLFKKSSDETFKFNSKLKARHLETDQYYPECPVQDEWNSKNIQQNIQDWKSSIFNNEDLHWFHNSSSEPLDYANPKIEITFDQLVGRKGFDKQKASHYFKNNYSELNHKQKKITQISYFVIFIIFVIFVCYFCYLFVIINISSMII